MALKVSHIHLERDRSNTKSYLVFYEFETGAKLMWKSFLLRKDALRFVKKMRDFHQTSLTIDLRGGN